MKLKKTDGLQGLDGCGWVWPNWTQERGCGMEMTQISSRGCEDCMHSRVRLMQRACKGRCYWFRHASSVSGAGPLRGRPGSAPASSPPTAVPTDPLLTTLGPPFDHLPAIRPIPPPLRSRQSAYGAKHVRLRARVASSARRARAMPRQAVIARARPRVRGRHSRPAGWRRGGRSRAGGRGGHAGEIGRGPAVRSESQRARNTCSRSRARIGGFEMRLVLKQTDQHQDRNGS